MANRTKIENLQDLIKDGIGGEVVEQSAQSLLPPGENYGSVMYKVDFKVKKDGKEKEYHTIAKCTPLNPITQEIFNIQVTFKSETAWYTTVIPTLKQFQKDHGVEKGIDFFQHFYGARTSLDPKSERVDLDGVILTQNLNSIGYHNIDRHVGFNLPEAYAILRDLATFHAVPLAIRIQNPEVFDKKIKPYLPSFREMDDATKDSVLQPIFNVLDQIPECQPNMERINKFVKGADIYGNRAVREPWITVSHADFWMNNIMVTEGKNPKTMILDLQTPRIGPPAVDLVFFLLTSVNLDVVRENYDDFVKFYYEQFCKNLRELHVPTENFTFEKLLEEITTVAKEGEFAHALSHTQIILGEKGKSHFDSSDENFTKEDLLFEHKIVANKFQKEKFIWIVSEAIRKNWI